MTAFNPLAAEHYTFWRDALLRRQNNVDIQVPVDKPGCGYFKYRPHGKTAYQPVAIWYRKDGTLICKIGDEYGEALKIWAYCAARPITKAEYDDARANGFPQAEIGDNRPPPEDFAAFEPEAEKLLQEAREWIKSLDSKPVETQAQADAAAALVTRLRKTKTEADKKRLELTKPHRDAEAAINSQWNPHIKALGTAVETLLARVSIFLSAQKAKAAEIEAQTGMKVEPPKAGAGAVPRAITPRTDVVVEVVDPPKAAAHYANHPEILEIVIKLAKAEYKATKKTPPGVTVREEDKAQ